MTDGESSYCSEELETQSERIEEEKKPQETDQPDSSSGITQEQTKDWTRNVLNFS